MYKIYTRALIKYIAILRIDDIFKKGVKLMIMVEQLMQKEHHHLVQHYVNLILQKDG